MSYFICVEKLEFSSEDTSIPEKLNVKLSLITSVCTESQSMAILFGIGSEECCKRLCMYSLAELSISTAGWLFGRSVQSYELDLSSRLLVYGSAETSLFSLPVAQKILLFKIALVNNG